MNLSFRKIGVFFRLPVSDQLLLVKAILIALFLRLFLKIFSFKTIVSYLNYLSKKEKTQLNPVHLLKKYGSLINCIYNLYPIINCLSITMTFWFLLKKKGVKTEVKFGMLKNNGKLKAHAWLEHDGLVLSSDKNIKNYKAFSKSIL